MFIDITSLSSSCQNPANTERGGHNNLVFAFAFRMRDRRVGWTKVRTKAYKHAPALNLQHEKSAYGLSNACIQPRIEPKTVPIVHENYVSLLHTYIHTYLSDVSA